MEIVIKTWNEKETLTMTDGALILSRLGKDRMIPLDQVVGFDVVDPKSRMSTGTVTIHTAGPTSLEDRVMSSFNVGGGITFFHGYKYLDAAREMQRAIAARSVRPAAQEEPKAGSVVSVVDEIRGLKQLLDEGILTDDEFSAKKRQLLGI